MGGSKLHQHEQSRGRRRRRRRPTGLRLGLLLLLLLGLTPCAAWRPLPPSPSITTRCRAHQSSTSSSSTRSSQTKDSGVLRRGFISLPFLLHAAAALLLTTTTGQPAPAIARTEPLGVINELLADCARLDNCVSSQDDRPPVFAEPWAYDGSADKAMSRLRAYVGQMQGAEVVTAETRYLRAQFRSNDGAVDDAEWFFVDPESDAIIEFRCARQGDRGDGGANARRLEKIRIALGYEKVPVLRNRRRALFIMESPLDAFGPSYGVDAPPPQELGQEYKDVDPFSPTWEGPSPYARPAPQPPKQ